MLCISPTPGAPIPGAVPLTQRYGKPAPRSVRQPKFATAKSGGAESDPTTGRTLFISPKRPTPSLVDLLSGPGPGHLIVLVTSARAPIPDTCRSQSLRSSVRLDLIGNDLALHNTCRNRSGGQDSGLSYLQRVPRMRIQHTRPEPRDVSKVFKIRSGASAPEIWRGQLGWRGGIAMRVGAPMSAETEISGSGGTNKERTPTDRRTGSFVYHVGQPR